MTATLELVAEAGVSGATVRAIADRAGVTPGLIRHYFDGKDDLVRTAYAMVMDRMTALSDQAIDPAEDDPVSRLAAFLAVSLRPPVMDVAQVGLWAGFLHQVRRDAAMREVHRLTYLAYRDRLQSLIEALPNRSTCVPPRALAIACNGMIDGLWLEGGVLPEAFAEGELEAIGLGAIGAILGVDLLASRNTGAA